MAEVIQQIAAKAVIINDKDQVLVVRESQIEGRSKAGQYQIVGGRVEKDETFDEALVREVFEEVGIQVEPQYPIYVGEWHPILNGVEHQIIAIFTVCKAISNQVVLSPEHDDFQWIDANHRGTLPIMEPDCFVIDRYAEWQNRVKA